MVRVHRIVKYRNIFKMFDQGHAAIGAMREALAVLRFAFRAEHGKSPLGFAHILSYSSVRRDCLHLYPTQISSYSMRSSTCGSNTRLRISGTKLICLNRSTAKPSSLKKEFAASQSLKASSAMLRPVTSVTRFNVLVCFVSG